MLKKIFCKQYISNMINLMFAVVMDLGFSASATLGTKQLESKIDLLNYFSALFGIVVALMIISLLPILLYLKKKDTKIDTEDAYMNMSRSNRLS